MARKPQVSKSEIEEPPQQAGTKPKSATHVTVACKIPAGLRLQLCHRVEFTENTMNGPRSAVRYDRVGEQIIIRGPAAPIGQAPRGYTPPILVGGYALTPNVPADFWDAWLAQNKDSLMVRNRMVFAMPSANRAIGEAKEHAALRSGLEPLNPDGTGKDFDPRMPRPQSGSIEPIRQADEMAGRATFMLSAEQPEEGADLESV